MAMVEEENAALLEELGKLSQKAQGTEQMMQEIATLNQMFSDQILGQAAQIEQIYLDAVHASANVKTGNVHLTKAVALNTSTRKIVLALLVTASLLLLFYDWFNS
ncbi:unnamed protein product [Ostreobium quekettii]|uniref:t-SNARE coiled-coil homology domain-containing protein n=1 Tax=Ostreobium quekettii TaxID=121088 RepID=A0A8S1IYC4_9CHLO|nr:unnamed protein product [Ostreobium quekettii]